MIQNFVNISF